MRASPLVTQGIGRYVVCDVTDLSCCGPRLNTVVLGISLTPFGDPDVGVAEQECDEHVISNTADAQRCSPKCRARNEWVFMKASSVCLYN